MSKKLVAYFSVGGITETAAKQIAEVAGADLYEIRPAEPYTEADLNWMDKNSRSSREMREKARPALADRSADIDGHSIIFLGFPIWWYTAPNIVQTFLESYDFSGKTIVLFATSGGSDFGRTAENLRTSVSADTVLIEGKILNEPMIPKAQLSTWANSFTL